MEFYIILLLSLFLPVCIHALLYLENGLCRKGKLPPGPKGLPIVGNLLAIGERPHESLAKLAKIHGPLMTVKLGVQPIVVVTSAEVVGEIMQKQDQAFLGRSVPYAVTAANNYRRSMVWMSGGPKWKGLRKIWNTHIFTAQRLDALQGLRQRMVDGMVQSLIEASRANDCVDIGRLVLGTTFNLMSNTIFSFDVLHVKSISIPEMKRLVSKITQLVLKPNLADCFPFLKPFDPQGISREIKISLDHLQDLIAELVDERMKPRRSGLRRCDDLLDTFLDLCNESSNFEEFRIEDLNVLILDLFVAGVDTVTTTTEWVMTELLRNPLTMAKAKQELKETIGSSNSIQEGDIPRLAYLQAVIKESMRLHTPVPLNIRETLADTEIYGYTLPKGTQVMVNTWALALDQNYWDEPSKFLPERFLEYDINFRGQNFYFIPFGFGRRICPGLPTATRMLGLILASFIHIFDWKLPDGMTPQDLDTSDKFGLVLQKAIPLLATPVKIIS